MTSLVNKSESDARPGRPWAPAGSGGARRDGRRPHAEKVTTGMLAQEARHARHRPTRADRLAHRQDVQAGGSAPSATPRKCSTPSAGAGACAGT